LRRRRPRLLGNGAHQTEWFGLVGIAAIAIAIVVIVIGTPAIAVVHDERMNVFSVAKARAKAREYS
jgi:hypothetical protein